MAQAHFFHPLPDENGQPLTLASPSVSTELSTWLTPSSDATLSVTDAGELPASLYNVAFSRRPQTPASVADWKNSTTAFNVRNRTIPKPTGFFLPQAASFLSPMIVSGSCIRVTPSQESKPHFPRGGLSRGSRWPLTPSRKLLKNRAFGLNPWRGSQTSAAPKASPATTLRAAQPVHPETPAGKVRP